MAIQKVKKLIRTMSRGRTQTYHQLLQFHEQHNHRVHTHWIAHAGLLGVALTYGNGREVIRQGWLCAAVIPVHLRNAIIRDVARSRS